MTRHLLPGEIIEAATRQLATSEAIEHLSNCPECKEKIEQYRATRMAVVPAGATQASPAGPECPPLEKLAYYAAGHKDPELAGHIAICDRCAWIVRDALESDSEPAPRPPSRRPPKKVLVLWSAVALVAALAISLIVHGMTSRDAAPSSSAVESESSQNIAEILAHAYTDTRPFDYLLSDAGYSAVRPMVASDHSGYVAAAIATIERRLSTNEQDSEAVAFEGRLNLLLGKYQEAIRFLTRVAYEWPDDPTPLRDLACAYALRGVHENRTSDYEAAARLFRKVLEKQPDNRQALFNLALTEEHLFNAAAAADQWRKYLALNPGSGWELEAKRHLVALEKLLNVISAPPAGGD